MTKTTKTPTLEPMHRPTTPKSTARYLNPKTKTSKTKTSKTKDDGRPGPGRPSLFSNKTARRVTFRLSDVLRTRLERKAETLGCSLSDAVLVVLERGLTV